MPSHVPLKELQERIVQARNEVFQSSGLSRRGKIAGGITCASFIATGAANIVLRPDLRWIGLVFLGIELIAWIAFSFELRAFRRTGATKEKEWLQEYDELAVEDGRTIDWIATFDRRAIVRSIETIKERSLAEGMAFSLFFGPAGRAGLLAVFGILYAQTDGLLSSHLTMLGIVVRVAFATAIAIMYGLSWPISAQHLRRDRLQLMLEFGLEKVDEKKLTVKEYAEQVEQF